MGCTRERLILSSTERKEGKHKPDLTVDSRHLKLSKTAHLVVSGQNCGDTKVKGGET